MPLIKGYISEVGDPSGAHYAPELLEWLDKLLAKITTEQPNHYVFVTTHPMLRGLAYGGDLVMGTLFWNTKELLEVLNKYPQVVAFGGHLHFPISDERSIMQDKVTNINCGAMSYMATENGGFREMLSVTGSFSPFNRSIWGTRPQVAREMLRRLMLRPPGPFTRRRNRTTLS